MNIAQLIKKKGENWELISGSITDLDNALVLVFGDRIALQKDKEIHAIKEMFPNQHIVYASTCGEILGSDITDDAITITVLDFKNASFKIASGNMLTSNFSVEELGAILTKNLNREQLKHVLVFSEGTLINGSELIKGIESELDDDIVVTGGFCGDSKRFQETVVGHNKLPQRGEVVIIGLYGESLEITYSSFCGWTAFGPERIVTKSKANVLYQMDGKPALDLYKKYLGDKIKQFPMSALRYPLSIKIKGSKQPLVRTILTINEERGAIILAGDVPEGSTIQLMMANVDSIIDGASQAASLAMETRKTPPEVALLISCVGRKIVMDQRVEEEIEEIIEVIGKDAKYCGFYSYGELAPLPKEQKSKLHNQTMTLTLISE